MALGLARDDVWSKFANFRVTVTITTPPYNVYIQRPRHAQILPYATRMAGVGGAACPLGGIRGAACGDKVSNWSSGERSVRL